MQANEQPIGLYATDMDAEIGLVSAHVMGRLNGLIAQVKVRQVYKNWSDANIECIYTFPLGWQSVLLGMRVELNGKSLTGAVKPKKMAEAQYEEAIDSGDLPVMLERSGKDLYTVNIGNIQTGDEVVIELDYAQILKVEEGAIRFSLPTTVAPRYGDASNAGLKLHQQAAADPQAEQRLFLSLALSENLSAGTVYSPTHEIHHSRQDKECTVKLEGAAWLDRDFVLVVDRIGDMNFAVAAQDLSRPGQVTVLTGGVFRPQKVQQSRPVLIKVLVDCSGSMQGDSIAQARDCLGWLLGHLKNNDQISFTRFGSSVEHDHPALQPCTTVYRQLLKTAVRRLDADLGGTEIDDALKEVVAIEGDHPEETQNAVILLITDGEVWNIEETIATVRASGQRIYAVGVGSSPAESLLKDMAEITGGACEMLTPRESMQKAVERLLHRMRLTQAVEQEVSCSAPIVWQSKTRGHAAQGESLMAWTQIQTQGAAQNAISIAQTIHPNGTPLLCPVVWDHSLELSRIAAALRLHDMSLAKEREALALEYQLVTSETNLILIHERAEAEKADELPELHQVRPMLAAGYGGNGTVTRAHFSLAASSCSSDNSHYAVRASSREIVTMAMPALWRTARPHTGRVDGMLSAGMDEIEIPAFLRKRASDDDAEWPVSPEAKSKPERQPQARPTAHTQIPQTSPEDLGAVLRGLTDHDNPIVGLVRDFNQAALTHNNFRSALAVCLRTNLAGYLQWLVTRHMKAAGSSAPIWAVFISWAVAKFSVQLDGYAERLLRDFLKAVKPELQDVIRADLDALDQHKVSEGAKA